MLASQNIELFTRALSSITIILIPDKGPKYRTVRLNTGHLAILNMKYINRPPLLDDLDPPLADGPTTEKALRCTVSKWAQGTKSSPLAAERSTSRVAITVLYLSSPLRLKGYFLPL